MDYKLSEDENYHVLIDELDKRGLDKERNEVVGLVHYLESMEQQFTNVLDELQQVRCQLEKIQDKGIRKTILKITDKAKEAVKKSLSKIKSILKFTKRTFLMILAMIKILWKNISDKRMS